MRGFLISSNLWVGLAVALLGLMSFPQPWSLEAIFYSFFLFFATISAYSYMRWVKIAQGNTGGQPHKIIGLKSDTLALAYAVLNGVLALSFLRFVFSPSLFWALIPALIVAVLYPLAFPNPNQHFTSLRTVPMLKLLLIALCWSWLSFGLPMIIIDQVWTPYLFGELAFRSLLVAGLTIPFDVRDIDYDSDRMRTIPQLIGIDRALQWSVFLLLIYEVWLIAAYFIFHLELDFCLAWLIGLELGALIIRKVKTDRSEWFIGFWVEGIPIFIFILYLLAQLALGNY